MLGIGSCILCSLFEEEYITFRKLKPRKLILVYDVSSTIGLCMPILIHYWRKKNDENFFYTTHSKLMRKKMVTKYSHIIPRTKIIRIRERDLKENERCWSLWRVRCRDIRIIYKSWYCILVLYRCDFQQLSNYYNLLFVKLSYTWIDNQTSLRKVNFTNSLQSNSY